jgi:hypothetical protein
MAGNNLIAIRSGWFPASIFFLFFLGISTDVFAGCGIYGSGKTLGSGWTLAPCENYTGGRGGVDYGAAAGAAAGALGILGDLFGRHSGPSSSGSRCDPGYGLCPNNTCAPLGNVCCGDGSSCRPGHVCVKDGCLSRRSKRICSNGTYCETGRVCIEGNRCLSTTSERFCADGTYCKEGFLCTTDGSCLSVRSKRICSNGAYCEAGRVCIEGNRCLSTTSERFCADGTYCKGGYLCTKDGSCLSSQSDRVCTNGSYCEEGQICIKGNKCLAATSERFCSDGSYCNEGYVCRSDGQCYSKAQVEYERQERQRAEEYQKEKEAQRAALNEEFQPSAHNPFFSQDSCDESDLTAPGGGSALGAAGKKKCAQAEKQPLAAKQVVATNGVASPSSSNTSPPSDGAAALESLRALMPELGRLIDEADSVVNSPNIPPPSQWRTSNASAPAGTGRRRPSPSEGAQPMPDDPSEGISGASAGSAPDREAVDDDYAEACHTESSKDGVKSLKQDFEEALKNGGSKFGAIKKLYEKAKLITATLEKCVSDPLKKEVIEKIERTIIDMEREGTVLDSQ